MRQIEFTVHGNPKAQKRHRTGKGFNYDPSASDKADFLALAHKHRPDKPITTAVDLSLVFSYPYPTAWIGKNGNINKKHISEPRTKQPDIDNLIKFVMDALSGVYWLNDAVVVRVTAEKRYSATPRVYVWIRY